MKPTTDRGTIRIIVIGLIAITFSVIAGLVAVLLLVDLTTEQKGTVIGGLHDLGLFAAGGVVGLLAHTASNDPVPAPQPGAPVNVPVVGGQLQVGPVPDVVPEPGPVPDVITQAILDAKDDLPPPPPAG